MSRRAGRGLKPWDMGGSAMRLSSIVTRANELNTVMGVTKQPQPVTSAVAMMGADSEALNDACHVAAGVCAT